MQTTWHYTLNWPVLYHNATYKHVLERHTEAFSAHFPFKLQQVHFFTGHTWLANLK